MDEMLRSSISAVSVLRLSSISAESPTIRNEKASQGSVITAGADDSLSDTANSSSTT